MDKTICCPECGSPVDRHDIYIEKNQIYCRRKCAGYNVDFPDLANYELPPPNKIRKPKEVSQDEIIFKRSNNRIDVIFKKSGGGFGMFLMGIGLTFILLGYLLAFTNIFDRSQPAPTIETMHPFIAAYASAFAALGLYIILRGIREGIGGYRAVLDIDGFYYGKILGKKWFRKKYSRSQLVEIRKYLQKISDRKYYYRIGFFIEGRKKPYYPKFYSAEREIDWLVYEFYKVWKSNSPNLDKEADFGEV